MTDSPTCPRCGVRLPPVSDAFCPECGERLDEPDEPSAKAERPATVVSRQEIERRQTRVMLGTMFGFLAGLILSWGCCGMTALSVFFAMHPPEEPAQYVQIGIGVVIVTFTTWAGRMIARSMRDNDPTILPSD